MTATAPVVAPTAIGNALDQLRVYQIVAQYSGVDVAEVNTAIENGALPARDKRTKGRHAYRVTRGHVEAWIANGCPLTPTADA